MLTRYIISVGLLLVAGYSGAHAALAPVDSALISDVAKKAAYADAIVDFCAQQSPASGLQNQAAFDAWSQRNQWLLFQGLLTKQPKFQPAYEQMRARFIKNLEAKGAQAGSICQHAPALLKRPEFDPSVQRAADIERVAAQLGQPQRDAGTVPQPQPKTPVEAPQQPESTPAQTSATPTTPVASGANMTVGEIAFPLPAGWVAGKTTPQTASFNYKDKKGASSIIIVETQALAGPVLPAFSNLVQHLFPDMPLNLKNATEARSPYGYQAAYFSQSGRDKRSNKRFKMAAVGVAVKNRLQMAYLLSPDTAGSYDRAKEFEAFVATWRFVNGPAQPTWSVLRPGASPTKLNGLYWGTKLENRINPFGGMDLIADRTYVLLMPTGQAYKGLPPGGRVINMNFAEELAKHPKRCGTYKIEGNQIAFDWIANYGLIDHEAVPFQRHGGSNDLTFQIDGTRLSLVEPVHNLRLNGRYKSTFIMVGSTATSSNSVASETYIAFTPDGRYEKSGFTGVSFSNSGGTGDVSGTINKKRGIQAGAYSIDGYRLVMKPDSGPTEECTLVIESKKTPIGALFIDDKAFLGK